MHGLFHGISAQHSAAHVMTGRVPSAAMVGWMQRAALERVAQLEAERARMAQAAHRRSDNLAQSRAFIRAYLQARASACRMHWQ
jgi:hypothetical protein